MRKTMTLGEFASLVQYIYKFHSPMSPNTKMAWKRVKYVDPHMDMRTGEVFSVTFRGFGYEDVNFHCCNEFRDHPKTLECRIMDWLLGVEDECVDESGKASQAVEQRSA
jgi:hypothetical protein